MSDRSDLIGVPKVQKTEGRQNPTAKTRIGAPTGLDKAATPPQSLTAKLAGNPHKKVRIKGGVNSAFYSKAADLIKGFGLKVISKEVISKISRNKRKE